MSLKRKFSLTDTTYFNNDTSSIFYNMGAKQSSTAAQLHSSKRNKRSNSNNSNRMPPSIHVSSTLGRQQTSSYPMYAESKPDDDEDCIMGSAELDEHQCERWFSMYADPDDPNVISPEGAQLFFEDLGLSVDDIRVIALAWKMNAATMGYITKEEWMVGMRSLGTDSMEKLKQKRPELEAIVRDPERQKELYRYTFNYAKNKDQKCMDVEIACALWAMMLGNDYPIVGEFIRFLQEKKPVRVINRDQWQSFLEFVTTISTDLTDYDETSAWPVLFDEFVHWRRRT